MGIEIQSTTDSAEAVQSAYGKKLAAESVNNNEESQNEEAEESVSHEDSEEVEAAENADGQEVGEADDSEEESEESSEEEEDESDSSEEEGEEEDQKKKRKSRNGYKRRVQKLNKRLDAAEAEKEYWRNLALQNKSNEEAPREQQAKSNSFGDDRPDPNDFESELDFIDALTDWKVNRKFMEQQTSAKIDNQQRELEAKAEALKLAVEDFALDHDDFEDVIESVEHIPTSPAIQESILNSDNGPALMYQLALHPEEYERINAMSPIAAAKALGRFEAKYVDSDSAPSKKPLKKKTKTKTPPPPEPVRTQGAASTKDPSQMSYQEYKRWRASRNK